MVDEHTEYAARRAEAYKKRAGTMDTCKLPCEKGLPVISATAQQLREFHEKKAGNGSFDPCSLLQRYQ